MDVRVQQGATADPFLSAAAVFETEYDLEKPVRVHVRDDPDERTCAGHYSTHHTLTMSTTAATSAMARELALHEFAHMVRYEQAHPSHVQSTAEALYLGLAGKSVERRKLAHCYQIANHMKDIYADDITLSLAPSQKLVTFLESGLASAVADRPGSPTAEAPYFGMGQPAPERSRGHSPAIPPRAGAESDPDITAVNAAFALALVERHDLTDTDHPLYDLAAVAASDAPSVDVDGFKRRFLELGPEPTESSYRKALVDATRAYVS